MTWRTCQLSYSVPGFGAIAEDKATVVKETCGLHRFEIVKIWISYWPSLAAEDDSLATPSQRPIFACVEVENVGSSLVTAVDVGRDLRACHADVPSIASGEIIATDQRLNQAPIWWCLK